MALTASSSASRPRAMMATSAPEAANRLAMASPIPLLAPVMTAVRPARLTSIGILPLAPERRARPLTSYSPRRDRESAQGRRPREGYLSAAADEPQLAHAAGSSRMRPWEHDDGIHRAISRRHRRDGRCLVGHANARASTVRRYAPRLH